MKVAPPEDELLSDEWFMDMQEDEKKSPDPPKKVTPSKKKAPPSQKKAPLPQKKKPTKEVLGPLWIMPEPTEADLQAISARDFDVASAQATLEKAETEKHEDVRQLYSNRKVVDPKYLAEAQEKGLVLMRDWHGLVIAANMHTLQSAGRVCRNWSQACLTLNGRVLSPNLSFCAQGVEVGSILDMHLGLIGISFR